MTRTLTRRDVFSFSLYCQRPGRKNKLARYEGELFWISTKTGEIRSDAGYSQPLCRPGYARGLAMTSDQFIVATSEFRSRRERHAGDSWIQVIDRQKGVVIDEIHIADTGSINDLRLLDEYDYV